MGIGTDIFRLGSKISSLFSFKRFRFNYGLYHTMSLGARKKYLSDNRNKLSKKQYETESDRLYKEYQREVRRLNDREILLNSNIEHKFVVSEDGSWDIIENVKSPKSYPPCPLPGIPSGRLSAIDMKWDWEVQEELKKKQVSTPSQRRYLEDIGSWEYTPPEDGGPASQWKHLKKQEAEKKKRIEEMNEGCILCITDTGAYCSPLIENCSPRDEYTFRYRMIINRMSKIQTEDEYKETLKHMFPFITEESITFDSNMENYFPLNLRILNYSAKFAAKWFFIKNVSKDSVIIYLKCPKGEGYNSRDFVVVKPGGIISLLYGDMLNCEAYNDNNRLPDDHEYIKQYKDKTHPLIV